MGQAGQARQTECHPERKHAALGLCSTCYSRDISRRNPAPKRLTVRFQEPRNPGELLGPAHPPKPKPRSPEPKPITLPRKHPLAADITLHLQLAKVGLSWLAVEQIRELRAAGVGLAAIAKFYGIPSTLVALATSYADLTKVVVPEGDINASRPRRPWHPADAVHFGRHYEDGDAY